MQADDLNFAKSLAEFLRDYGIYAFTSLSLLAVGILYRALRRAEHEKFEVAMEIAPLTDRLMRMVERAAQAKARRGSSDSRPSVPPEERGTP